MIVEKQSKTYCNPFFLSWPLANIIITSVEDLPLGLPVETFNLQSVAHPIPKSIKSLRPSPQAVTVSSSVCTSVQWTFKLFHSVFSETWGWSHSQKESVIQCRCWMFSHTKLFHLRLLPTYSKGSPNHLIWCLGIPESFKGFWQDAPGSRSYLFRIRQAARWTTPISSANLGRRSRWNMSYCNNWWIRFGELTSQWNTNHLKVSPSY